VVVNDAVGAPVSAVPEPVAPIAPDPFVPDVSTPLKVMTVIDAALLCDSVAVAVTLVSAAAANARQISAVPIWVLVRFTSCQVRPAPVIPVTVVLVPPLLSAETNANSSSLAAVVENDGVAIVVALVERSVEVVTVHAQRRRRLRREVDGHDAGSAQSHRAVRRREGEAALGRRHRVGAVHQPAERIVARRVGGSGAEAAPLKVTVAPLPLARSE